MGFFCVVITVYPGELITCQKIIVEWIKTDNNAFLCPMVSVIVIRMSVKVHQLKSKWRMTVTAYLAFSIGMKFTGCNVINILQLASK